MAKTLPGTTIPVDWSRPEEAETRLNSLFLAGGLMLSQVASLTGLEPYVIQNWVRRGFAAPPERKRYSRRQFCRIVLINMLKDSMQLDKICTLLSYVNGELDDESDDLIDDAQLYLYFVRLVVLVERKNPLGSGRAPTGRPYVGRDDPARRFQATSAALVFQRHGTNGGRGC